MCKVDAGCQAEGAEVEEIKGAPAAHGGGGSDAFMVKQYYYINT